MPDSPIHQAQILLIVLLVFIVGFGALAQRLKIAYPIVLVIGGLLVSFVPWIPKVGLDPDFIFLAVLPPLLFASATQTSWAEFKYNLVSIGSLAFGLVLFTVVGVAVAANWLLPGFDWRLGLVLGAAVAPTDAIAAAAIAQRVGLPKQIVDLLEGESLVNDASGLLALEFSVALVVSGSVPTFSAGLLRLLWLLAGGVAVGLVTGRLVQFVHSRVDNARIEIALSLVTPYAAYSAGEAIGVSGVLATVAVGLYLGRHRSSLFSSRVRMESHSFWSTFTFLLNGIVFLLIGLELPTVLHGIRTMSPGELLLSATQLSVSVILLRLLWVFPAARVGSFIRRKFLHQPEQRPGSKAIFIVGWTGMRGVVSLAAVIGLPQVLANGEPFPQRNVLIFLTFTVILVTLVLQGLTLPPLIRALQLSNPDTEGPQERRARRRMIAAALDRIAQIREESLSGSDDLLDGFEQVYRQRLSVLAGEGGPDEESDTSASVADGRAQYRGISRQLREVERATVLELGAHEEVSDGVLRRLERELDLMDIRFSGV